MTDLDKTIADLREEFERIRDALWALERLATAGKRRGRPPKWLARVRPPVETPAPKPTAKTLAAASSGGDSSSAPKT
jgi:hypothetical protein